MHVLVYKTKEIVSVETLHGHEVIQNIILVQKGAKIRMIHILTSKLMHKEHYRPD